MSETPLSVSDERGIAGLGGALTAALVVQPGLDLGGVPLMVQLKQPVQDFLPNRRPNRVPNPLPRLMEPMIQPAGEQVIPPIRPHHSLVDRPVNLPQFGYVRVGAVPA